MQNRNSLLIAIGVLLAISSVPFSVSAQTTFLPLWSKEMWLLDRMEIKAQRNNELNLSTVKPYMRLAYVAVADSFRGLLAQGQNPAALTKVDQYNLDRFQANSSEFSVYTKDSLPQWKSKRPWGQTFFATKANMVEVDKKGFYLSVNPAFNFQRSLESNFDDPVFVSAYGINARGLIGKKVGFQMLATGHSEQGPIQFRHFVANNRAIPGFGFFDSSNNGKSFRYFDFRGSVSTNITKYINIQFGHDQQFIGNGYRSLLFSNFSGNALFLKLNTRIWRLNYTNLFMQIQPSASRSFNESMKKKYASMHHLSMNVTKWLNIGFFEAVVFGRTDGFDFSYLQPVIFLRSIEQQNGSPDNANIGADFKMNVAKKVQVYGQLMVDEFLKDEAIGSKNYWWGNKQGVQLGVKYVDAFGISNLDVQAEFNQARPFMYQFRDSSASYTSYSQPMALPLGANVREIVGILRYQPTNKLYLFARLNYWKQGLDSAGYNFGSNPNISYNIVGQGGTRPRSDNFPMFAGKPATGLNGAFTASYEIKENLFIELNAMLRRYSETDKETVTTSVITLGARWNLFRRDYDY